MSRPSLSTKIVQRARESWPVGLLAAVVALACVAPAGAVVIPPSGPGAAPLGLAPIAGSGTAFADPLDGTTAGVTYHGGPVVHGMTTYALYWDPAGAFDASTEQVIDSYLQNIAHVLPLYYVIEGLNNVMIYGNYGAALDDLGVLLVVSVIVFALAVQLFKWRED